MKADNISSEISLIAMVLKEIQPLLEVSHANSQWSLSVYLLPRAREAFHSVHTSSTFLISEFGKQCQAAPVGEHS